MDAEGVFLCQIKYESSPLGKGLAGEYSDCKHVSAATRQAVTMAPSCRVVCMAQNIC